MASFHDRAMTSAKAVITDTFGGRLVRSDLSFHLLGSGAEVDPPKNKTSTVLNPGIYVSQYTAFHLKKGIIRSKKMGINQEDFEKLNMRAIVISSMMTAFGLVVALAWKDTINATVAYLMPDNNDGTLQGMYITAIAVTALVMGLAMLVLKLNARVEKEIERVQSYFDDDDEDEEESKES